MRRSKDQIDRRPWAVRDTRNTEFEIRTWHKANGLHLVRMLNEQHKEPGRFQLYDRIKERKART